MAITVGELLEMPHLRLSLQCGAAGLDNPVSWTHTADIPSPWKWLTGGELLMTNGVCVPRSAGGQEELLRQLVDHGAAGLAIGSDMYCPPLTRRFTHVSEELGFPVLWIAYPMPFVSISRAVAEATLLEQSQRLIRTERIYRTLQRAAADKEGLRALTTALSKELQCLVLVCATGTGRLWYGGPEPDPEVREAVVERRGRLRAGITAATLAEGRRILMVDVPTHADAVLVCLLEGDRQPDAVLLLHASTVCALALSQARLRIEHDRGAGAELLGQVLDGYLPPASVDQHLRERGLNPSRIVAVALHGADPDRTFDLHVRLWRSDTTHLTVVRSGVALSLVPAAEPGLDGYLEAVGDRGNVGVSDVVGSPERVSDAASEARWALDVAEQRGVPRLRYSDAVPYIGPRTPEEARAFVRRTLQPLLDRPEAESAELLGTLSAFLDNRRSWQRTGQALQVHRQTVLYRIRKIEQLTGLDLSETADLATLWVAVEAWRHMGGGAASVV